MSDEDSSRARILDAATHLFAHRGFGSTSVREVVERAGVTKPTLYYWFQSKEALYLECVRHQFDEMSELVKAALHDRRDMRTRLRTFIADFIQKGLDNVDGVQLAISATNPSFERRPEVDLLSFHQQYVDPIKRLISDGVARGELRHDIDPGLAVAALLGTITTVLKASIDGHPIPDDYPDQVLDLFLNGAGAT